MGNPAQKPLKSLLASAGCDRNEPFWKRWLGIDQIKTFLALGPVVALIEAPGLNAKSPYSNSASPSQHASGDQQCLSRGSFLGVTKWKKQEGCL